ncbi:type I-U CRISPR-associated protein Cas5/Cas6 [Chloracidobacterium validum]|uniref:Type I-U CRISPR-associated protein Cas5/Cas6 n=1 Tax=Chloracidobacterium validum TaxID=2821543 RepID=A0ABX8BCT1_9BACT|nr:type I-U CRISPR-associated protein Csb2 [Chloracidobacterium validum]QUW04501.1 type I-U CRISPR-associated protein Cas5/Cas6 [Chloracidobacterium validum]
MTMLTLAWRYLTGYARATDPATRNAPEWPPHPARVWLALAATFFETGANPAEGEALVWLASLPDPALWLPATGGSRRRTTTVYVPVNDRPEGTGQLQSAPLTRSKQPRTFPTVWVGDAPCYLHWPDAPGAEAHRPALAQLCAKVTRLGHSASLVQMWVADAPPTPEAGFVCWLPETDTEDWLADHQLRRLHEASSLERLREAFAAGRHPTIGLATGYRPQRDNPRAAMTALKATAFDQDLFVLAQTDGPSLPVEAALQVTQALRATLMRGSPQQPPPAWLSGHEADGQPLADGRGHLAFLPLPFVGYEHADGRLLGVALAFPPDIPRPKRGAILRPSILDARGQPAAIQLKLGRLGVWVLRKRAWDDTRATLRPETWTAFPEGAICWASVTPVVLDRFPKANRLLERAAWEAEVGQLLFTACRRAGLPEPVVIDFDPTSWHVGAPRAVAKERPLRGQTLPRPAQAKFGGGFPPYLVKGATAPKPQLHVFLQFAEPVVGPVLLGAGRFFGYGLFKPLKPRHPRS